MKVQAPSKSDGTRARNGSQLVLQEGACLAAFSGDDIFFLDTEAAQDYQSPDRLLSQNCETISC
ncbi:hypothetical protein CSB45_03615 [candidate division KSB3 bacterium]|uniref:Uncharacterized protein n=1 Tax=candidate division KSB3 bacterium TaxID=2044937 RepID=A0A2G6E990_9BACT|nr:MAG: hypothetical protein CSB45_03615 [candidate division KSB3 bacterium]PIE29581.1 MAG: hypothetical protein CSA57_08210 [candidate division KSB3 bacterium]